MEYLGGYGQTEAFTLFVDIQHASESSSRRERGVLVDTNTNNFLYGAKSEISKRKFIRDKDFREITEKYRRIEFCKCKIKLYKLYLRKYYT